jgi:hypothetical protein
MSSITVSLAWAYAPCRKTLRTALPLVCIALTKVPPTNPVAPVINVRDLLLIFGIVQVQAGIVGVGVFAQFYSGIPCKMQRKYFYDPQTCFKHLDR